MRFLIYMSLLLIATTLFAATTNVVRTIQPWVEGGASGKENWAEVIESAKQGFDGGTNDLNHSEVVAWSVKLDHLDCPPRLSEEAIVLINCIAPGRTNSWALGYVGRMHSAGTLARSWRLFDFPQPLSNFITFQTRPDDAQIASFIRATNFGFNDFYPDRVVSDVVLYHKSEVIENALQVGLSETEKRARHSAYLKSIPY